MTCDGSASIGELKLDRRLMNRSFDCESFGLEHNLGALASASDKKIPFGKAGCFGIALSFRLSGVKEPVRILLALPEN